MNDSGDDPNSSGDDSIDISHRRQEVGNKEFICHCLASLSAVKERQWRWYSWLKNVITNKIYCTHTLEIKGLELKKKIDDFCHLRCRWTAIHILFLLNKLSWNGAWRNLHNYDLTLLNSRRLLNVSCLGLIINTIFPCDYHPIWCGGYHICMKW